MGRVRARASRRIARIVSGGQTGADRAALDFAIETGLPYGGWCPSGGWAEDLTVPPGLRARYPLLRETPGAEVAQRTVWNVRDSDATLVVVIPPVAASTGVRRTIEAAIALARPHAVVDPAEDGAVERTVGLLAARAGPVVLNVAGPRESEAPGVYAATRGLLEEAFCRGPIDP